MLTEEELTVLRDENERRKELRGAAIAQLDDPDTISTWDWDDYERHATDGNTEKTIDRLLAEIAEYRLLLRDAVQDATPGNRLWREGVKAGLEAAAETAQKIGDGLEINSGIEEAAGAWESAIAIRAIDPSTILPPAGLPAQGGTG